MNAEHPTGALGVDGQHCWCCGGEFATSEMVSLGAHPEVTVCVGCARFLHRRARLAEEQGRGTVGARVRRLIAVTRNCVIASGLHDWPVLGWALRRLDRWLP